MPSFNCDLSRFSMKSPRKRFTKSVTNDSNTILNVFYNVHHLLIINFNKS